MSSDVGNSGIGSGLGSIPIWGNPGDATTIAGEMISLVQGFINNLENVASNLFAPTINPVFPTVGTPPSLLTATMPSLQAVTWQVPAQPAPFVGTLDISKYLPGPFTGLAPTLNFGNAPAPFAGQIPGAPSVNYNYTYPEVSVTLPTPSPLLTISDIQFDPINIPQFTGLVPELTLLAPSIVPYVEKAFYTSTELSTVQASLISAMTNGTDTGLDAATQQAMWDAAREREYRQMADALAALERDAEMLNYAYPPGVFLDSRTKIQTEFGYTVAGLSRDIMIKQAELHLENVTKSRELAITLEGNLINYYNATAQRAFEAAKYVTDAQVQIYNAGVQAFTARIEGYKASIEAFNAQIRGLELYIEQLKAEISFEQTKAEINTALVQQYKTEVDAALATLEVAKTQVEIIQTEAQVEKLKVDTYGVQVQAFVGTVNAYTAQIEGYKAQIEAQSAIENVYKVQVDAYTAQVQAGVAAANALVNEYDGRIKAYEAQLEGYKASLSAMVEQARAAQEYNTSQVETFKGEVQALTSYNQVLTSQWEAVLNEQEKITEVAVKAAEANGQLYIAARQLSLDAAKTGAQTAAQLGAAALNAIHFSNTSSWSLSESLATSISNSTSTTTNTNYNSSV